MLFLVDVRSTFPNGIVRHLCITDNAGDGGATAWRAERTDIGIITSWLAKDSHDAYSMTGCGSSRECSMTDYSLRLYIEVE